MDRPELLASYCPGCGCSPARAPCQKCGTPAPDQVDPSPADGSVYGLLGLGVFSLGVAAYLLLTLEGVAGWVGGGFLTLVGTALIAMFAWNRIADEREWTLVADGARATVVLGRLGVVFATGWREERGPLEVDVADLASCSAGDLWAALEQRLHPIETLETALPELMALAAAARGEVVVRRCSRVAWGLRSGRVVEQ
ncbi:MAG: hypothetical protein KC912_24380, partial [Proteobacteria bacterium]|nr:hypothetical protein [Pseudomonadota bacterium]